MATAKRHQRQRSSVTVKKRASQNNINLEPNDNVLSSAASEPANNALLSPSSPNSRKGTTNVHHLPPIASQSKLASPKEEQENVLEEGQNARVDDYFSPAAPFSPPEVSPAKPKAFLNGQNNRVSATHSNLFAQSVASPSENARAQGEPEDHNVTTRTELDLFGDEDQESSQGIHSGKSGFESVVGKVRNEAKEYQRDVLQGDRRNSKSLEKERRPPALPTKDETELPPKPPKQNDSTSTSSPALSQGPFTTKSQASDSPSTIPRSGGQKRLSLLTGGGISGAVGSADSPIGGRRGASSRPSIPSPSTPTGNSTPRGATGSIKGARRLSLAYIPSPSTKSSVVAELAGAEPSTPSSSAGGSSYFARNGTPRSVPATTPVLKESELKSGPSSPVASRRKEDGDTVMTQHKGVLERIAEKERTCLELRERLAKEEANLKELQMQWHASVHRDLAKESTTTSPKSSKKVPQIPRNVTASSISSMSSLPSADGSAHTRDGSAASLLNESENGTSLTSPGSVEPNGTNSNHVPPGGASETLKDLSKKLPSGWGTQIGAFFDQLANVPLDKGGDSGEQKMALGSGGADIATTAALEDVGVCAGRELDVLDEEGPEEETGKDLKYEARRSGKLTNERTSSVLPPKGEMYGSVPRESSAFSSETSKQAKRSSVFGSLAAFQRQVEQQFLPSSQAGAEEVDKSTPVTSPGSSTGWGTWQKRLKEARENASGLLAKAEQRLGQAMTIDELIAVAPPETQTRTTPPSATPSSGGFEQQNDREKAALAELSWLNSLAGVHTVGNANRATATKRSSQEDERLARTLDPHTLMELEAKEGVAPMGGPSSLQQQARRPSSSSVASGSSGTTTTGAPKDKRTSSSSNPKRMSGSMPISSPQNDDGGLFSMFSNAWGVEKVARPESQSGPTSTSSPRALAASPPSPNEPIALSTGTHRQRRPSGQNKSRLAAKMAMQGENAPLGEDKRRSSTSSAVGSNVNLANSSSPSHAPAQDEDDWSW